MTALVYSSQGYFRDEARTQATLDPEGWLHTGDIGEWTRWAELSSTAVTLYSTLTAGGAH